jgi:hypothetical protein
VKTSRNTNTKLVKQEIRKLHDQALADLELIRVTGPFIGCACR